MLRSTRVADGVAAAVAAGVPAEALGKLALADGLDAGDLVCDGAGAPQLAQPADQRAASATKTTEVATIRPVVLAFRRMAASRTRVAVAWRDEANPVYPTHRNR